MSELFRGNYLWDCIINLEAAAIVFCVNMILSHVRALVENKYVFKKVTNSCHFVKNVIQILFVSLSVAGSIHGVENRSNPLLVFAKAGIHS